MSENIETKELENKIGLAGKAAEEVSQESLKVSKTLEVITKEAEPRKLGFEPVTRDKEKEKKAREYLGILEPVIDQVRSNKSIRDQIAECLAIDPDKLDGLPIQVLNKYLVLIPKGLVWLQECENLASISYDDACNAYEDTIQTKAALLEKKDFDVSQVSEKMRIAKIRAMFPNEYEVRVKEIRTRKAILTRLEGQSKHLERFNDNLKKIRDGLVAQIKKDPGTE